MRQTRTGRLTCAVAVFAVACLLPRLAAACVGDCNNNQVVDETEIQRGIDIALAKRTLIGCERFDRDGDSAVSIDEVIAAEVVATTHVCPADPTPTASPTPIIPVIFPANYRQTFVEVRDCRFSVEHDNVYIRVLASPDAVEPYLTNQPLPVGSMIVKEEYSAAGCNSGDLIRWRPMRKEDPGFDPDDGDWHWQYVVPVRQVLLDDKSTCITCHSLPECLARDYMCTVGGATGKLTTVLSDLAPSLMSISGTSVRDVYTVGADPGDGFGPYVLHYDGTGWRRLPTGATGNLWWVSDPPIDGLVYFAGDHGLILKYDPATGVFERQTTPGTELLYGIWGSAANDIWAVGGDPAHADTSGVAWHFDGQEWKADPQIGNVRPEGLPELYKVWGRGADDVYAAGRLGVILHYDGIRWSQVANTLGREVEALFTIHGNATDVAAVGDIGTGLILELAGDAFADRTPLTAQQFNGVFLAPDGRGAAVGVEATLALRSDTGWALADTGLDTTLDFHAVWIDEENGAWAVGGDLYLFEQGMVAYSGNRKINSLLIQPPPCPPPSGPFGPRTVSYTQDIVPLFDRTGCLGSSCHGGVFPSSSYDMRTYEDVFGPGAQARTFRLCDVVPGSPDESYLIEKLRAAPPPRFGSRMPNNESPLSDDELALVRTWILEGAQNDAPATATPTATPTSPPPGTATPTSTTPTVGPPCDQPGTICTVAGTGQSLFNGDNRLATQTALYYPLQLLFDAEGLALIDDWNNLRLRRINANGRVQTLMGTGAEDFPVEGALAVDTSLHHASEFALDTQGQIYVAGGHVPVVFRVGTDDRVHIVAGMMEAGNDGDNGPALQARLNSPFGVLPVAGGAFYIADVNAHVIRFVDAAGMIHTVAGIGTRGYAGDDHPATTAALNGPTRVRLGPDGGLYITDTDNHAIRKIDTAGVITTVAGTGQSGYSGDNDVATAAKFNGPYDLAFSPAGDLYVADSGNNVIRRIATNGVVTSVVGTGTPGFAGDGGAAAACQLKRPSGIAFSADGSLWIADTFNQRVRRVAKFLSTVQ